MTETAVVAWATVTETPVVAVSWPSEIVAVNVYVPASGNVTADALAALVPFAAKVGVAPAGADVVAQV